MTKQMQVTKRVLIGLGVASLIGLAGAGLSSTALAEHGGGARHFGGHGGGHGSGFGPGGMFGGKHMFKMLRHLDLSREQRSQLGKIMDRTRPLMRETMLDMMDARKALAEIVESGNFDEAAVRKIAQTQAGKMADVVVLTTRSLSEARALLTPEQLEQLEEFKQRRRGKYRHGPRGLGDEFDFDGPASSSPDFTHTPMDSGVPQLRQPIAPVSVNQHAGTAETVSF